MDLAAAGMQGVTQQMDTLNLSVSKMGTEFVEDASGACPAWVGVRRQWVCCLGSSIRSVGRS